MDEVVIPAGKGSPELRVHVNPVYALYHYLRKEAEAPLAQVKPETAEATATFRRAFHRSVVAGVVNFGGLHGLWDVWEQPLTTGATIEAAVGGLRREMVAVADGIGAAMAEAEPVFNQKLWPQREPLIEAALTTIRETFEPQFPAMALRQAELLDHTWPDRVDAYLVTDCYDRFEAYSRPLTVDVAQSTGIELCETLLHEATHVADVHTNALEHKGLEDRLILFLLDGEDVPFGSILNARHALIFVSSADQVRTFIDPNHVDYALPRGLYDWFNLPNLPAQWAEFAAGRASEEAFFAQLRESLKASGST